MRSRYLDDGGHPLIILTVGLILNILMVSLSEEPVIWVLTLSFSIVFLYFLSKVELAPEAVDPPHVGWLKHGDELWLPALFWSLMLIYELTAPGRAERATLVHSRVHINKQTQSCMWVFMTFVGGMYPGSVRIKCACCAYSHAVIVARLWVLAQAWENINGSRSGTDLYFAAVFEAEAAEPRLAVELLRSGTYVLVCMTLCGFVLGLYCLTKWEAACAATVASKAEMAELRAENMSLEQARREALIRSQRSRRSSGAVRRRHAPAIEEEFDLLCDPSRRCPTQPTTIRGSVLGVQGISELAALAVALAGVLAVGLCATAWVCVSRVTHQPS